MYVEPTGQETQRTDLLPFTGLNSVSSEAQEILGFDHSFL